MHTITTRRIAIRLNQLNKLKLKFICSYLPFPPRTQRRQEPNCPMDQRQHQPKNEENNSTPMNNLSMDMIIRILQYLSWNTVLRFGQTNRRYSNVIRQLIDQHQLRFGAIPFVFGPINNSDDPTVGMTTSMLRQLFELYGHHLWHVTIHFGHQFNMSVFRDYRRFSRQHHNTTFLTNVQHLWLYVCSREADFNDCAVEISPDADDVTLDNAFTRYDELFLQSMIDRTNVFIFIKFMSD